MLDFLNGPIRLREWWERESRPVGNGRPEQSGGIPLMIVVGLTLFFFIGTVISVAIAIF